ncbi:hypothetical protein HK101_000485 [Irineochytrium annulatum]|nr:hypothetical protein HK101_000485 [Irineochytrium annulatum]
MSDSLIVLDDKPVAPASPMADVMSDLMLVGGLDPDRAPDLPAKSPFAPPAALVSATDATSGAASPTSTGPALVVISSSEAPSPSAENSSNDVGQGASSAEDESPRSPDVPGTSPRAAGKKRLSVTTARSSQLSKLGLDNGLPVSPSPLSPLMLSAIEQERILGQKTPPPEIDKTPRPQIKIPTSMRRIRVIIQTEVIEDPSLPEVVPKIMSFIEDEATLRSCLYVNKIFMLSAVRELYSSIVLTGTQGPVLTKLVKLMAKSADGETLADYRSCVRNLEVSDMVLDEQEVTPFQSWNLVRELIRRVAPFLNRLHLDTDDFRFMDPDYFPHGTCGLDQRVTFTRIKALSIGAGCVAFPDTFILDVMRRCPTNSLSSIRLPGCISSMAGTGYFLISERGGTALHDLIMTPPSSYPPRLPDFSTHAADSDSESDSDDGHATPAAGSATSNGAYGGVAAADEPSSRRSSVATSPHRRQQQSDFRRGSLGPYDPNHCWDPNLLADGLSLLSTSSVHLKALDLSGHTNGLRPGALETFLRGCEELEELDLPCGVTDATLYEILTVRPKHLWRINLACSCHRSQWNPITPGNVKNALPCSFITDGVVRALLDLVLAGKPGALIMLPSHVMEVKTARMVPMLAAMEAVPGAKVDMTDTNGVYVPRIGVNVVVPNGRLLLHE